MCVHLLRTLRHDRSMRLSNWFHCLSCNCALEHLSVLTQISHEEVNHYMTELTNLMEGGGQCE